MSDLQQGAPLKGGYDEFVVSRCDFENNKSRIGVMLKNMRESAGLTQEKMAEVLMTKRSSISRMENHAENITLSTLLKVAAVFGKRVKVSFI